MSRLPLDKRIFFKVFALVIAALGIAAWVVKKWVPDEWTVTNLVGSSISAVILTYLIHLWLLPGEDDESWEDQESEQS